MALEADLAALAEVLAALAEVLAALAVDLAALAEVLAALAEVLADQGGVLDLVDHGVLDLADPVGGLDRGSSDPVGFSVDLQMAYATSYLLGE